MKLTNKQMARIENQSENITSWKAIAEKAYKERSETKPGLQESYINSKGERVQVVHVTIPSDDHKLKGLLGINTSVTNNLFCVARRDHALKTGDGKCVCLGCYADNCLNRFKQAEKAALYNQHILAGHILTDEEISHICIYTRFCRFEMFGDISNIIQARNYIRIARANKSVNFGAWSKNWNIWKQAFEFEGKPENMTFVWSSLHLDKVDEIPATMEKYVDYIFTVCEDVESYNRLLKVYSNSCACAGVSCLKCQHCYNKGNNKHIFELLR